MDTNKKFSWKKVMLISAIMTLVAVCSIGYEFVRLAHQGGMSPQKMALRMWRGGGHNASWLNMEDDGTEYISNPTHRHLGPAHGYLERAVARIHLGKIEEAKRDYTEAKAIEPEKYGDYFQCRTLAQTFAEAKMHEDAVAMYEEMLSAFPTYNNKATYAMFLAKTQNEKFRDPPRAVSLMREACELMSDGGNRYDHEMLAWALAANSKFKEAIAEANVALSLPPGHPDSAEKDERRIKRFISLCEEEKIEYSPHF